MFEILGHRDADLTNVLDLYSGTGALGIEAISRGADHCDFVESDPKTCEVIRDNLRRMEALDRGDVYCLTVKRALPRLKGPYTLVVADPPYEYDRAESEMVELVQSSLLAPSALLLVEHSKRHLWPEELGERRQALSRRYGDTQITLYQ
jgi:16S rRNA (guanine966-N2)-methyltransferase